MAEAIRVLVVDDHLVVREGLRLILETEAGFEWVGEAADGAEAVRLAGDLHPDVILMDLRMPRMDGISAIRKLQVEQPNAAVVILTTFDEDDLMLQGLQAGAKGFLLKDTSRDALFATIRAAAHGETLLSAEVMARLMGRVQAQTMRAQTMRAHTLREQGSPAGPTGPDLTDREHEVLLAVARGERSKEIGHHLGISERTVKAHLASIYNKLGVDSRAAAIAAAAQKGLLPR